MGSISVPCEWNTGRRWEGTFQVDKQKGVGWKILIAGKKYPKNRNEEDSSFKVKNGSKTNVYRKKEPVEQPTETPGEVAAEQFEGE